MLSRPKPENPWPSKQVSRVPLYANAPIAYDGPVYARVDVVRWSRDCTWIKEFLGLFNTISEGCLPELSRRALNSIMETVLFLLFLLQELIYKEFFTQGDLVSVPCVHGFVAVL